MKNILFTIVFAIGFFVTACNGQQINSITSKCITPTPNTYATVSIDLTGNITATPCPTKAVNIASDGVTLTVQNSFIAFGSVSQDVILNFPRVVTTAGTTGDQTINRPVGTVNFAAGASAITVTNDGVNASSIIFPVIRTADATCTSVKSVVVGSLGHFTITLNNTCTAETSVGFLATN